MIILDAFETHHLDNLNYCSENMGTKIIDALRRFRPRQIVFVTSSELFPFSTADLRALVHVVRMNYPDIPFKILSQACVGFHAFLVDFAANPAEDALAIFLEMPSEINQQCLDAIGAGKGGDELRVQECYGFLYCVKRKFDECQSGSLVVHSAHVFCQSKGIYSTPQLAKRVVDHFASIKIEDGLRIIAFDVHSRWSTELRASFAYWLQRNSLSADWLPSFEHSADHFSALKPLLELQLYKDEVAKAPIAFVTLGAGGRLGLSVMSTKDRMMCGQASLALEVNRETFDFPKEMDAVQSACDAFKRDRDLTAFHSAIRRRLHYIDAKAPRRDNTFYIWDLAQLAKPCGPA